MQFSHNNHCEILPTSYPRKRLKDPLLCVGLLCSMCDHLPTHPRMGDCEHVFCDPCLCAWLKKATTCPICRHPMTPGQIGEPNLALRNAIAAVEVSCEHHERGCTAFVPLSNLKYHLSVCQKIPLNCCHPGCGSQISKDELATHEVKCPFKETSCELCGCELKLREMESHLSFVCAEVTESCKLCEHQVKRKDMQEHLKVICSEVVVQCPVVGCNQKALKRKELAEHLASNDSVPQHMSLLCESVMEMKDILAKRDARNCILEETVRVLKKENELLLNTQGKILLTLQKFTDMTNI